MANKGIPTTTVSTGLAMPVVGLGTANYPPLSEDGFRSAMLDAVAVGYRHFDTASLYQNEEKLGAALAEALSKGLLGSREELFISSKLWIMDAHPDRVVPSLKESLRNLQLEYVDLYLIHWPVSLIPHEFKYPIDKSKFIPLDLKGVWEAMEECQTLGLAKSIGVSNFSCKKLEQVIAISKIPPAVNQVEMQPIWQQKKLLDFCKEKGVTLTAYSPLGGNGTPWGSNRVIECDVLKEIAMARGKSVAQISLRWIYQQGATLVVKSFKKERMQQNMDIFDWELSEEELHKISQIPQKKRIIGEEFVSENGPFKSIEELWDGEI